MNLGQYGRDVLDTLHQRTRCPGEPPIITVIVPFPLTRGGCKRKCAVIPSMKHPFWGDVDLV